MFTLSYYVTTTEIKEVPYYIKEVDDPQCDTCSQIFADDN